jgi:hypothetical protein
MRKLTLTLAALLLIDGMARAEIVYLGKRKIRLPAPVGYSRFTGYGEQVDQHMKSFVSSKSCRLLAGFSSEENVARVLDGKFPDLQRYFTAQSYREDEDVNTARFKELKAAIHTEWSDVAKLESDASSVLSERFQARTEVKGLFGVFDETDYSISYSGIATYSIIR